MKKQYIYYAIALLCILLAPKVAMYFIFNNKPKELVVAYKIFSGSHYFVSNDGFFFGESGKNSFSFSAKNNFERSTNPISDFNNHCQFKYKLNRVTKNNEHICIIVMDHDLNPAITLWVVGSTEMVDEAIIDALEKYCTWLESIK